MDDPEQEDPRDEPEQKPGPSLTLCAFLVEMIGEGLKDGSVVRLPGGRLLPAAAIREQPGAQPDPGYAGAEHAKNG